MRLAELIDADDIRGDGRKKQQTNAQRRSQWRPSMKSTMQTQRMGVRTASSVGRVKVETHTDSPVQGKKNTLVLLKWKQMGEEFHSRSVSVLQRS